MDNSAPYSLIERLRRGWRVFYRLLLLFAHIFVGVLIALSIVLPWRKLWPHSDVPDRIICNRLSAVTRFLGLRIRVRGKPAPAPVLLVSNHISWADILVLGSLIPGSFVAKAEIRRWPVIGWLSQASVTVFIARGQLRSFESVVAELEGFLRRGRSVFIFPEGRTSAGELVQPFRRRLFKAARDAGVGVQPVAIRYPAPGGCNPAMPYIGGQSFLPRLAQAAQEPFVEVELIYCTPLSAEEAAGYSDMELARISQARVTEAYF